MIRNEVKRYRKQIKMSQQELALKTGIARPYLSEIEQGKRNPTVSTALKISKALNQNVENIFFTSCVQHVEQNSPHI